MRIPLQLLLIGARQDHVEEELGIDIDEQKETQKSADLFKELKIRKEQIAVKPFIQGRFPEEEVPMASRSKIIINRRISWDERW
jgi:hypothetical protein